MLISYNWLQDYFEEKLPEPEKLTDAFTFHNFEVESTTPIYADGGKLINSDNQSQSATNQSYISDYIFDIKILPDRAHDCLSYWGIAKEISAILEIPLNKKELGPTFAKDMNRQEGHEEKHTGSALIINIETDNCRRYMGQIVRGVKVGPSPDWLRERLESIGQRSINNIVDIANFVMFEIGNPIHAFDLDKLEKVAGSKEEVVCINIRNAKNGEKITTLDKKEINLDESVLVIADLESPLAIAGIKGGDKAEVDKNTKDIVIEVANFKGSAIRKISKRVNILTDASKRFENEINPELCQVAINKMVKMVLEIAGGEPEKIVDVYKEKFEPKKVFVTTDYINKRLGTNFKNEEIKNVWVRLKFEYEEINNGFEIIIPELRLDIGEPHDLSEEVVRVMGYDRVEEKIPEVIIKDDSWECPIKNRPLKIDEKFYKILLARKKLLEDGYSEVMTYTFTDRGELEVLASASDKKFLRTNLTDGLKESIRLNKINLPLLDVEQIKVFEIGTVFTNKGEKINVCWADEKNITEMTLDKFVSENFPTELKLKEIESLLSTFNFQLSTNFKPWSIYPFIVRDIAVWVPENIKPEELSKIYKEFGTELLIKEPKLFDQFTKEGRTSYAFRLVFQSYERTLTDEEVGKIMAKIEEKIKENNWEVR